MLTTWNYDESVKRVSNKVQEWKTVSLKKSTLTDEICRELYEAREQLAKVGRPETLPNGRIKTWDKYLQDVGLAYRSDLMPNGSRLTWDIPLSKRYQTATRRTRKPYNQSYKEKRQTTLLIN